MDEGQSVFNPVVVQTAQGKESEMNASLVNRNAKLESPWGNGRSHLYELGAASLWGDELTFTVIVSPRDGGDVMIFPANSDGSQKVGVAPRSFSRSGAGDQHDMYGALFDFGVDQIVETNGRAFYTVSPKYKPGQEVLYGDERATIRGFVFKEIRGREIVPAEVHDGGSGYVRHISVDCITDVETRKHLGMPAPRPDRRAPVPMTEAMREELHEYLVQRLWKNCICWAVLPDERCEECKWCEATGRCSDDG